MFNISIENNQMLVKTAIPSKTLCDGEMVFELNGMLIYLYKPEKISENFYLCSEDITKYSCPTFGLFGKVLEGVKQHYERLDNFTRTYQDFLARDY